MNSKVVNKYLALQEQAMGDGEYRSLVEEYRMVDGPLLRALEEMPPEHRDAVLDYLGVVFSAHHRMLELALCMGEKT